MRRLKAGRIYSHLGDVDAPGYQAPEEADAEAYQAKRDAEFDLVETEPTTHAGIVALLAYVDDFHTGAFADPDDPKWYSQPEEFEDWEDEQIVMRHCSECTNWRDTSEASEEGGQEVSRWIDGVRKPSVASGSSITQRRTET